MTEVGSGFSSLVIAEALQANDQESHHRIVDPFPSQLLADLRHAELHCESAATVDQELFTSLERDDVLFIDTSHAVRPGGEVVRLVFELLPILRPGVIVQFHDFFRPFEYPRVLYEWFNVHWQEQYLLQAFLAYNPNFEVLCANHALWRLRRKQTRELFEGMREDMQPSALWLRRIAPPDAG